MSKLKVALPIILVVHYTVLLLLASKMLADQEFITISQNRYINFQINYQLVLLVITGVSLTTTYFLNKRNFIDHFTLGRISAPAQEMKLFGIKAGDTWLNTGISLIVVISLATGTFMFFEVSQANALGSLLGSNMAWILVLSLTNSFGEEMIYRIGVVSPLKGLLSPMKIFAISAILFGLPHFAGTPNGIIGVTMAGVLGLVLAKSVYETRGIFWAWTIHFIQDVIIIGALCLQSSVSSLGSIMPG